jgi:hypothetical protein
MYKTVHTKKSFNDGLLHKELKKLKETTALKSGSIKDMIFNQRNMVILQAGSVYPVFQE